MANDVSRGNPHDGLYDVEKFGIFFVKIKSEEFLNGMYRLLKDPRCKT